MHLDRNSRPDHGAFSFPGGDSMKEIVMVNFRPKPHQAEKLRSMAEATGLTMSDVLRTLVDSAEVVSVPEFRAYLPQKESGNESIAGQSS